MELVEFAKFHFTGLYNTCLTEEEYAEFSGRVSLCKISQAGFIRQALIKPSIYVWSMMNCFLLLENLHAGTGNRGKLNQIVHCLDEYGAPYNVFPNKVRPAISGLAALKFEVLQKAGEAVAKTALPPVRMGCKIKKL